MSPSTPYLALGIFPVVAFLAFNLNPVQLSWSFHHGFEPMPNAVRDKLIAAQPVCTFLADVLILVLLGIVVLRNSITLAGIGLQLQHPLRNVALGSAAAVSLFALQRVLTRLVPVEAGPFSEVAKRRPVSTSVGMFLAGAFSEELWVAVCLVTLSVRGHSVLASVVLTSIAFGVAHFQPAFGSAFAVALKGSVSALLFVWTGSLLATFTWHFLGNLGSLYNARHDGTTISGSDGPVPNGKPQLHSW